MAAQRLGASMFMLYAIALAIAAGLLMRGKLTGLTSMHFRWGGLALGGLAVQVALFSAPVTSAIGDVGAPVYVASSALVLLVVLRNLAIPGMVLVAVGAASNLAAIVANGGWMPATPSALGALNRTIGPGYSNSRELAAPMLAPLTDTMALPAWLPLANVFSVGDVLIGFGICIAIVAAMRLNVSTTPTLRARTDPGRAPV
jgi:hypothetical protein